ncbi:hypothetical protein [Streptomyces sp. TRM64462]|uniref:hypothetical protein n=1 Tax=Streptomyces sp. TRM64462 TaxID=2741726 RepID=UPI0015860D70|nr:hypothetical protein [Streptomyces sp. TRM64462]
MTAALARRGRRAVPTVLLAAALSAGPMPLAYGEESPGPPGASASAGGSAGPPEPTGTGGGGSGASPEASMSGGPGPSGSASPGPSPSGPTATFSPGPSLAGRPAGAGRTRPGRTKVPWRIPSVSVTPSASVSPVPSDSARTETATVPWRRDREGPALEAVPEVDSPAAVLRRPTPSADTWRSGPQATGAVADRRVPVLTLGVGLALMGLGIGFLGLRLRRR